MAKTIVNNNIKLKSGGGILNGANGVEVDQTVYPRQTTMPAYENLVAGDLLKTINDGGTYKLKKIVGIGATKSGSIGVEPDSSLSFCFIDTNKIAVLYYDNNSYFVQVGTISGTTITFGSSAVVKYTTNISSPLFQIKKVDTDKFVIAYPYKNATNSASIFARAATVIGTAVTLGTETTIYTASNSVDLKIYDLIEINTSKFVLCYNRYSSGDGYLAFTIDSGTGLTLGAELVLSDNFTRLVKLQTDAFAIFSYYISGYDTKYKVCSVSGVTITASAEKVYLNRGGSDYVHDSYLVERVGDNAGIMAYVEYGSGTTLRFSYWTRSGDTLTDVATSSFTNTIADVFTKGTDNMVIVGNNIYFLERLVNLKKFAFDASGNISLIKTSTGVIGINFTSNQIEAGASDIFCLTGLTATLSGKNVLLDHDEFITSANAAYTAGDSVPLTDRFTGFSGLANGLDYYINADASGLTFDSTYQKIGKAINDTTILK